MSPPTHSPHTHTHSHTHTHTAKLVVTTACTPSPTVGPVVVETVLGGIGTSSLTFSYITESGSQVGGALVRKESGSTKVKKPGN